MKPTFRVALLCFFLSAPRLFAGGISPGSAKESNAPVETQSVRFPFEFDAEFALFGDSEVARGFRHVTDMDEDYTSVRFIYTPRVKFGILRLGAAYERFGFKMGEGFEVPRGLQSITAIIGLDTQLSDSILVRFEAQPGFYSGRRFESRDFHAPFILGGTYILNSELQFVLGVSVDYERSYPVFPGGGVRWRFAPQWVLNAVAPTPRLEYELTKNFILYGGADLKGSTFRVDDHFGVESGNDRLKHAVITYSEVRAGLGFDYKLSPEVKISIEGGYVPYRNFDFHRTDVRYHQEEGGAYAKVGLNATF